MFSMRAFIKKRWPLLGLGIMLAWAVSYLVMSGKDVIGERLLGELLPEEGLKLKDIHYTQDDAAQGLKWVLDAEEVTLAGDNESLVFRDFLLQLESKERSPVKLRGKKGGFNRATGVIELWGDLDAHSGDGFSFKTDHLIFNQKTGIITTESAVEVAGPFFSIEGKGLFVDLNQKGMKVLSNVTTRVDEKALL
jgi:LPS export ABC transporter protein LptC